MGDRHCTKEALLFSRLSWQSLVLKGETKHFNVRRSTLCGEFNQRVLMALHSSAPYDCAGYWHRTSSLLSSLKSQGLLVSCATRPGYPWDLQKHRDLERVHVDLIENVEFHRLCSKSSPYKRGSDLDFIDDYAMQLANLAKSKGVSVIHGHSNYLNGLAAIQAAKKGGIYSVYEARGFWHITQQAKTPGYENTELFEYESKMELYALNGADSVVTLSNAMKTLMVNWGVEENKIHVMPNAVDTEKFTPINPNVAIRNQWGKDSFIVGFIGSLTTYEGLADLIKATSALVTQGHNIHLVIAGTGPIEAELKKQASGLKFVHIVGRIPHEEVIQWYSCFDLCVYPRTDDVVCRYVPPMKVLEAMAMEIPVIVSDLAPLREMIEHGVTGLVCQPSNVESLSSTIELAIRDLDQLKRLGSNGRQWVIENRTWKVNAKRYKSLYESFK
ncbi:glycosyltransferase family 4 protein [Vibrio parahaemolyticus]